MVHTNNITVSIHKTNCKEHLQNPAPRQSLKQQQRASSLGGQPCRTALCMLIIIQLRERCDCSKLGFTFKDKNYQLQQPEAMRQHTQRARVGKMCNSYILAKYFPKEATDPPYPLPPLPISHSCPIWYVLVTAATLAKLIKIKLCVLRVFCKVLGSRIHASPPSPHMLYVASQPGEEAEREDALMQQPGFPWRPEEQGHSEAWANILTPNI